MPTWNLSMQNANSPLMEQLIFFHDHTMLILILILTIVLYVIMNSITNFYSNRYLLSGHEIELFWTIMPTLILIFIAFPSLRLLYLMDESHYPSLTIKVNGHQWYWSYEYSDFNNKAIDSFMLPTTDSLQYRLLDVDNRICVPIRTQMRFLISSEDVIHSWTIPALGIKVDAVPGRLNQLLATIKRPSLLFGQCSEICGANHSFMPIAIDCIKLEFFLKYIKKL